MRWRLLAHPWFTGAVAVLALNDHVLKGAAPGPITGKLSDFAGVFILAVLLAALTNRPRLSCCAVGLGFVTLKTSPLAAQLAAPFLGGVTGQDLSDVVALTVLAPAYCYSARRVPASAEPSTSRILVTVAAGSAAILTVSATSCVQAPAVDAFVVADDGTVFARVYDETYDDAGEAVPAPRWAYSIDGGATWQRAADPPTQPPTSSQQACSTEIGCFHVRSERVEHAEAPGGEFSLAFAFSDEQRERIKQRSDGNCEVHVDDWFRAIAVVHRPVGDHVVVAMGSQGALHRTPDGTWTRVGVLDRKPVSLNGPSWLLDLSLAPLVFLALSPVPLVLAWRRGGRARGLTALAVAGGGSLLLLLFAVGLMFFGVDYVITGPLVAVLALGVFGFSVALALARRRGGAPAWTEVGS